MLDRAVVELADYNGHLAAILGNNRAQIDSIVTNLATIVATVGAKLPTLDHAIGFLDDAALRLANVSQYGEWLDQDLLCFKVGNPVDRVDAVPADTPTTNSAGLAGPQSKSTKGSGPSANCSCRARGRSDEPGS